MAVSDCLPSLVPLAQNVGLACISGHFAASTAASSLADKKVRAAFCMEGFVFFCDVAVLFMGMCFGFVSFF